MLTAIKLFPILAALIFYHHSMIRIIHYTAVFFRTSPFYLMAGSSSQLTGVDHSSAASSSLVSILGIISHLSQVLPDDSLHPPFQSYPSASFGIPSRSVFPYINYRVSLSG